MNCETYSEAFVSRRVSDARQFVQSGDVLTREVRGPELHRLRFIGMAQGVKSDFIANFHCRIKRVIFADDDARLVEIRGVSAGAIFWRVTVPLDWLTDAAKHRRLYRAICNVAGAGAVVFPGRTSAFCRALLQFARDDGIAI